jgi:hypothetical protein
MSIYGDLRSFKVSLSNKLRSGWIVELVEWSSLGYHGDVRMCFYFAKFVMHIFLFTNFSLIHVSRITKEFFLSQPTISAFEVKSSQLSFSDEVGGTSLLRSESDPKKSQLLMQVTSLPVQPL